MKQRHLEDLVAPSPHPILSLFFSLSLFSAVEMNQIGTKVAFLSQKFPF